MITFMYYNDKDCLFEAFMCNEDDCKSCELKNHKDCSFKKLSHLKDKAESRLNFKAKTLRSIFEIQEKIMKQLRGSRQMLLRNKEENLSENLQFITNTIFQKKDIKGLTGAKMNEYISQLSPSKWEQEKLEKQLKRLNGEVDKMAKRLIELRQQIIDSLLEERYQPTNSKILSKGQERYLMKQLNNPPSLKLLFRASQHNFTANKFHELCDGISDTVTIVRTEFGKTIAAFTPLKWKATSQGQFVADDSKRSFLLQLELKEKMALIQPQYAILNFKNCGPYFGGGADLAINDKCNQNQNSRSNLPYSYNCNGKYQNNQQSYTAFCGNPNGCSFRVTEYQVFEVCK